MCNTFTRKFAGLKFVMRPIDCFDLLGVESYAPVFQLEKEREKEKPDFILSILEEQADYISQEDNTDKIYHYQKHIVTRCILKISGSKKKKKALIDIIEDRVIVDYLYRIIAFNSLMPHRFLNLL